MHRFYAEGGVSPQGAAMLSAEDARHAIRVLRMQPGDTAELFAAGHRYAAEIAAIEGDSVSCRVL